MDQHETMGRVRPMTGCRALLLSLAAIFATLAPGQAVQVTTYADASPTVAGSLRDAIEKLNAGTAGGDIIFDAGLPASGTIGLVSSLPACTKFPDVRLSGKNVTISGAGSRGAFTGSYQTINADASGILRFASCSPAISITNSSGSGTAYRYIRIDGSGSTGISVTNSGGQVTMEAISISGDRGGDGITIAGAGATLRGIFVQNQSGNGIDVSATNSRSVLIESYNPASGTVPAITARLHNFIGVGPQPEFGFGSGVPGPYTFGDIDSVGVAISESGTGSVTVRDLDIGACDSHGLQIDPDNSVSNVRVQRVHIGVVPELERVAELPSPTLQRRVVGDGLRILGGRAEVIVGDSADVNFNHPGEPGTNVWEHSGGDLGVTVAGARGGTGITVGLADDPVNGNVTVRYARSGMDSTGDREVVEAIVGQGAPRRQVRGIFVNTNSGSETEIDNCQATGNTTTGIRVQGSNRLKFNNNIVGLDARADDMPSASQNGNLPLGNGVRTFHEGTRLPSSAATGTGVEVDISNLILTFDGNTISGNARDGLVITNTAGTPSPPIGTTGFGDGSAAKWNHIGTQGRGLEAGGTQGANPNVGRKVPQTDDAAFGTAGTPPPLVAPAPTMTNDSETTPRWRGNGTTIFSSGGGTPGSAVGSGFIYRGAGAININGITISDNAVNGLVIDTPQGNNGSNVVLRRARIGTDDTGNGPTGATAQSMGNGTIGRGKMLMDGYANIAFREGIGIQILGDGDNLIGLGSPDNVPGVVPATDRNVVSANFLYGIQIGSSAGISGLSLSDAGQTNIGITNTYIGTSLDGASNGAPSLGRLGFGNGHQTENNPMAMSGTYPLFFGAGIRVEPNSTGRHLIGGDDIVYPLSSATTESEGCLISNNALAGIWLRGVGNAIVNGNQIGTNAAGTASLNGTPAAQSTQKYGVLIEQPEHFLHQAITGTAAGGDMQSQYVGQIPFTGLPNMNPDPQNQGGGPGYYGNLISGNGIFGVDIEDNGNHFVLANAIGTNVTGDAPIANGGGMPQGLSLLIQPGGARTTAGVGIGATNPGATGQNAIGDGSGSGGNVISGNDGHGVAQYRDGVVVLSNNTIGANRTRTAGLPNSGNGLFILGNGINIAATNLISGNSADGVKIEGTGDNILRGNGIGVNGAGTGAIANNGQGIWLAATASGGNNIGQGSSTPANALAWRNVISGNAQNGILIDGSGPNVVVNNRIGTSSDGTAAVPNGQNAGATGDRNGIKIVGGGNNQIGGLGASERNWISGNPELGVRITQSGAGGSSSGANLLRGNWIGLSDSGADLGNGGHGVGLMDADAAGGAFIAPTGANTVSQNVISGNGGAGVYLEAAGANTLSGNRIGSNPTGAGAVANDANGVTVAATTTVAQNLGVANTGDTVFDNGNLISGNTGHGIELLSNQAHKVVGNWIGVQIDGTNPLPNSLDGVRFNAPTGGNAVQLGGSLTGEFNLVSGNSQWGIRSLGVAGVVATRNRVGLNAAGTAGIPNGAGGLSLEGGSVNTISDNGIAGNGGPGVQVLDGTNTFRLNRIGTNLTASSAGAVPNTGAGMLFNISAAITPSPVQTIGVATEGNVISGNGSHGIHNVGAGTLTIVSNVIGQDITGAAAVANTGDGIRLEGAATINIGGTQSAEQNSIGGNGGYGIRHLGQQVPTIVNNRIGTNANGTAAVGNTLGGVLFDSAAAPGPITLGGANAAQINVVSGNGGAGVNLGPNANTAVILQNNRIGTNAGGTQALGNNGGGVVIQNAQNNTIGNTTAGNVISGNGVSPAGNTLNQHGILVIGGGANLIENNAIGGDLNGGELGGGLGNTGDGIRFNRTPNANVNTVRLNTLRENAGSGVAVQMGGPERITNNRILRNGILRNPDGTVQTVTKLPLDLGADNALGGPANANAGLARPQLLRLLPISGGTYRLTGTIPATTTAVEIYRAADPVTTPSSDLTSILHHGGADGLLATVPVTAGTTTFTADLTLGVNDLVTALAFDSAGNTSEFSRNMGRIDGTQSTVVAAPLSLKADGLEASTVTVTLLDAIGTPQVGVDTVTLSFNPAFTGLVPPAQPLPATNAAGQTSGVVKATQTGTTEVKALAGGATIPATGSGPVINFVPANLDVTRSTFVADKTVALSNGADAVTFTFTIRDTAGNPIPGQVPVLEANPNTNVTLTQPAATDANGQTTATATSTVEQQVTFRGLIGANEIPSPVQVSFEAVPLDPAASRARVLNSPIANDNVATATLELTLVNVNGNPLQGVTPAEINITAVDAQNQPAAGLTIEKQAGASDSNGKFLASLRGTQLGTFTLTIVARGRQLNDRPTVQLTAGAPSSGQSTLAVDKTTATADDTDLITVTVTVRDQQNQPTPNEVVTLSVQPTAGITITQPGVTDAQGVATGTVKSSQAGTYQISAAVGPAPGSFSLGPQTVTFVPNPPSAGQSSVVVAPNSIDADGVQTAVVSITLLDGQGRPLAGVLPGEVQIEALQAGNPAAAAQGVTIVAPTAASSADGQLTAALRGTQPQAVIVRVTVRGVALANQPQVTLRDFVQLHYEIGTHMIGIPATPLDPSPAAVFAGLLPGLRLARWSPTTESYVNFVPGAANTFLDVAPGKGLWLQIARILDLRVVGTPTANSPFGIDTVPGWNQLGNPFGQTLIFELARIDVFQNGTLIGNLATPAAQALVDPYAWKWDPVLGYLLVLDPNTAAAGTVPATIELGRGMWMKVNAPGVRLVLNAPAAPRSRATRSRQPGPTEWLVSLQASSGEAVSQANLLGVGSSRLRASLPPEAPVAQPVQLRFLDEQGRAVAADVRTGPITHRTRWTAVVDAPADSDVTLAWPGINRGLPQRHSLWLIDPTNGKRVLMNSRASYTWQHGNGSRQLYVEVDPHGTRSLQVTSLAVKPGASRSAGVPVEFTLTAPATVQLDIKGLRGTMVRQIREQVESGAQVMSWDRRDNQGRKVPGGVYLIELTATTDDGEIVKVQRTVTID